MTDKRNYILEIIEKSPGIRFRDIMRISGLKNGVLSHHLRHMEDRGRIRVSRGPGKVHYSSLNITEEQFKVARALQRSTTRAILLALTADNSLRFAEIVERCKKSPSTISIYLTDMIKEGLVKVKVADAKKVYYTNYRSEVNFLVDIQKPPHIDRPVSGFEDIINSL